MTELIEALKEISESDTKVNLAITSTHIKYLTENVNKLTSNVNCINDRVSINEKRLNALETSKQKKEENRATFWSIIQKNWWRTTSIVITLIALFIAEFEIVRQISVK